MISEELVCVDYFINYQYMAVFPDGSDRLPPIYKS